MMYANLKRIYNKFLKKLDTRLTASKNPILNILLPFYYLMKISGCACFTIASTTVKVTIIDYVIFFGYLSSYVYLMVFNICFSNCLEKIPENSDIELFGTHFIYAAGYVICLTSLILMFLFRMRRFKILTLFDEVNNLFLLLGSKVNFGSKCVIMYSYLLFQIIWLQMILITNQDLVYILPNLHHFAIFTSVVLLLCGIYSKLNTLNDYISDIFLTDFFAYQNAITILVSAHDKIAEALTLINFCYGFQFLIFFCTNFVNTLFTIFGLFQDLETVSTIEALGIINFTSYNISYGLEIIYMSHKITNMVSFTIEACNN